jgi:hypothetical protein
MPITVSCPGCKQKLNIRDDYAGKPMKCPRCSAAVSVPADDEAVVAAVEDEVEPAAPETAIEEVKPVPRHASQSAIKCPECGKRNPADARKCRDCGAWLEEEEEEVRTRDEEYLPCPQCNAPRPEKVNWTWWGSYLGPRLCYQVRCRKCNYTYNGVTGGTNLAAKILFVVVPIVAIVGIIVTLVIVKMNN